MKKLVIIVLILLGVIVAFLGGMKREKFNYIDVCLDMGGGMNPGNYEICVIDNTEPDINLGGGIDPDFPNITVCTDDAKQCPDGSYVGREGKNCEFTKCPGIACTDYTYSTCPGSCVATCRSSHCSEPDENGAIMCNSDCDGTGSCIESE